MKCLETRRRDGMKWRRYRDASGLEMTTFEVPCEVLADMGKARLQEGLDRHAREWARRLRNQQALQLLESGWKPDAVAHELGMSASMVRRIRQLGAEAVRAYGRRRSR